MAQKGDGPTKLTAGCRRKGPQSTVTDYRKCHIHKHSKRYRKMAQTRGWSHRINTGRDADAEGHTKYSNDSCVTNGTSEGLNFMKALKSPL